MNQSNQSKKLKELNENYGKVITVNELLENKLQGKSKSDIEGDFIYVHENDVIEVIGVDVVNYVHNIRGNKTKGKKSNKKQVNDELTESIVTKLKEESDKDNITEDNVYVMLYE